MNTMPAPFKSIKNFTLSLFVSLSAVLLFTPPKAVCGELSSSLQNGWMASPEERIEVLVFFDDTDVNSNSEEAGLNRSGLHRKLYHELTASATNANRRFEANISARSLEVDIKETFWITAAALVEVKIADLESLAALDGVSFVAPDTNLALVDPVTESEAPRMSVSAADNLKVIGADKLWARGLTGEGRLVGSFDTGVDGDHPALQERWMGNFVADRSMAWFDPYGSEFPEDNNGHGSHVMGIMAGIDGGDTIGVAFESRWISASVIDRGSSLSRTISDILKAFEWAADPDGNPETIADVPDVICHSWGIPAGIFTDCDNTFWSAIDNLESLGVVCIFAAGNEGPDSLSIRQPADRATGPLNAFAVGAIDQIDPTFQVAGFSSRGPSRCDRSEIKPEVVAPGMIIRSCSKNGEYKYMSGTSMAAPHVAGAVALLRQYNPEATSDEIKQALYNSARDLGPEGEDNAYGMGLVDLEQALNLLPAPSYPEIEITTYSYFDGYDGIIESEDSFDLVIEINNQNEAVSGLWGKLIINESDADIYIDSAGFGSISAGGTASNQGRPFVLRLSDQVVAGQAITADIDFYDFKGEMISNERITIIAGQSSAARLSTLNSGTLQFTVDNFGGFGHAGGSLYGQGGHGFMPADAGLNIMSEFSLVLIDPQNGNVSDCARSEGGYFSDNDFLALDQFEKIPGDFGDIDHQAVFSDENAETPLGIEVSQKTSIFTEKALQNCVVIEYSIPAIDLAMIDSFYLGILTDWDLSGDASGMEKYAYDQGTQTLYAYNQNEDLYVGIRFISGPVAGAGIHANPLDGKSTLSDDDKLAFMCNGLSAGDTAKWGDYYATFAIRVEPDMAYDSVKSALAMVTAGSLAELNLILDKAYERYNISTSVDDIDDGEPVLPGSFSLSQNYPNPFNMATSISFELEHEAHVVIEAYNLLGQKVAVITDGHYPAGKTDVNWDGRNKSGHDLASGMYLYRMIVDGQGSDSRKMMILK